MIILLSAICSYWVPFAYAFEHDYANYLLEDMLVLGFDIMYCIDIALIFNTSYRDSRGEEINDKILIRDNYLKNHFILFILDVLSLVGNYLF